MRTWRVSDRLELMRMNTKDELELHAGKRAYMLGRLSEDHPVLRPHDIVDLLKIDLSVRLSKSIRHRIASGPLDTFLERKAAERLAVLER